MENKFWKKPELVILARSLPEERVLGSCKSGGVSGANSEDVGCYAEDIGLPCAACSGMSAS